jgi:erythromycin esterase
MVPGSISSGARPHAILRRMSSGPWRKLLCLALAIGILGFSAESLSAVEAPDVGEVRWLAEHAVPVRSIAPEDEDFSDLIPLMGWIGSSRVVALGEVTHGDGAMFLAKARLVRFLHQVMGFDVLAWEAGFYDVPLVDAALRSEVPLPEAAAKGLYRIWWKSVETQPVFSYVRSSQTTLHPILTVGFDCRVSNEKSRAELFPASIFGFFDRLDPALISKQERADLTAMSIGLLPADVFEHPGERRYNRELPRRLIALIDQRRPDLLAHSNPREIGYVRQSLLSFLNMDHALGGLSGTGYSADRYTRDTAMAENLLWLLNGPLAGRKVIVWAHNYHLLRDVTSLNSAPALAASPAMGPMGLHLARALGRDLFVIGALAHHGINGEAGEKTGALPVPAAQSLEGLLHAVGKPRLLLNLRDLPPDHWLRKPITAGVYFYEPQVTEVPRLYDAVLFLDEMTPSHAVR